MSLDKKVFLFGVPLVAIVLGTVFYFLGNAAPATPATTQRTVKNYVNADFRIILEYPASWQPLTGHNGFNKIPLVFQGSDGFFGIDAIGANAKGITIDDVVKNIISEPGTPYGTSPVVTTPKTNIVVARLIMPSTDQAISRNGEAAFVVQYPEPVKIGTDTFSFFMVYADKNHIESIVNSLQMMR